MSAAIFFFFFSPVLKTSSDISCKMSPIDNCMKGPSLFSGKNKKKKIIILLSAELAQRVIKVLIKSTNASKTRKRL